jgi:hypothetical protein
VPPKCPPTQHRTPKAPSNYAGAFFPVAHGLAPTLDRVGVFHGVAVIAHQGNVAVGPPQTQARAEGAGRRQWRGLQCTRLKIKRLLTGFWGHRCASHFF